LRDKYTDNEYKETHNFMVTTSLVINKRWAIQSILSWHQSKLYVCFLLF